MSDLNLDDIRARAEVAARELYEGPWQEPDAALRKALDGLDMIPFTSLPTSSETTE